VPRLALREQTLRRCDALLVWRRGKAQGTRFVTSVTHTGFRSAAWNTQVLPLYDNRGFFLIKEAIYLR